MTEISEVKKDQVKKFLLNWQDELCTKFSSIEEHGVANKNCQSSFFEENWDYKTGGGGRTRVLSHGKIFEQAGVNFSHVIGENLPKAATQNRPQLEGANFEAMGVSLVIHPKNPQVPTSHANLRLFIANTKSGETVWWFGGGFDLTPYYPNIEDCIYWHQEAKSACMPFGGSFVYNKFKTWADDYFYLKHRCEHRGIGGLFFDDLNEWGFDATFDFVKQVGSKYISAYMPIVEKNHAKPYTDQERQFQLYRRGRYVEFNLLFDRGTIFGIQSGGRTESILMSLPPEVNWRYNWHPEEGTKEYELTDFYLKPQDWLELDKNKYKEQELESVLD